METSSDGECYDQIMCSNQASGMIEKFFCTFLLCLRTQSVLVAAHKQSSVEYIQPLLVPMLSVYRAWCGPYSIKSVLCVQVNAIADQKTMPPTILHNRRKKMQGKQTHGERKKEAIWSIQRQLINRMKRAVCVDVYVNTCRNAPNIHFYFSIGAKTCWFLAIFSQPHILTLTLTQAYGLCW